MGIDMASHDELIAYRKSIQEIRRFVGADSLAYL
jgi:amidophosphoribosyltransferase